MVIPLREGIEAALVVGIVLSYLKNAGAETAILLSAVSLQTTALMNFIGSVLGLTLAIGLGIH